MFQKRKVNQKSVTSETTSRLSWYSAHSLSNATHFGTAHWIYTSYAARNIFLKSYLIKTRKITKGTHRLQKPERL